MTLQQDLSLSHTNTQHPIPDTPLPAQSESWSAQEVVHWTLERFDRRAAFVTSFQAEGMVVLDIALGMEPQASIVTIDTGRLPPETYDLMDRVRDRYGCRIDVIYPEHRELEKMVGQNGVNAFYKSVEMRQLCCYVRKASPLNRVLEHFDAWVTGLTRSQGGARAAIPKIAIDAAHNGIVKVSPLADWPSGQVWDYIRSHDVPYNALYDQGYDTIGCAPCTRAVQPGEDPRAGRWWWEKDAPKECGIHLPHVRFARAPEG